MAKHGLSFNFDPVRQWDNFLKEEEKRLRSIPIEELEHELVIANFLVTYKSIHDEVNRQNKKLVDLIESVILERTLLKNDRKNTQEE